MNLLVRLNGSDISATIQKAWPVQVSQLRLEMTNQFYFLKGVVLQNPTLLNNNDTLIWR